MPPRNPYTYESLNKPLSYRDAPNWWYETEDFDFWKEKDQKNRTKFNEARFNDELESREWQNQLREQISDQDFNFDQALEEAQKFALGTGRIEEAAKFEELKENRVFNKSDKEYYDLAKSVAQYDPEAAKRIFQSSNLDEKFGNVDFGNVKKQKPIKEKKYVVYVGDQQKIVGEDERDELVNSGQATATKPVKTKGESENIYDLVNSITKNKESIEEKYITITNKKTGETKKIKESEKGNYGL